MGQNYDTCPHCGAEQCDSQPQSSLHLYSIDYECGLQVTFEIGGEGIMEDKPCKKHENFSS